MSEKALDNSQVDARATTIYSRGRAVALIVVLVLVGGVIAGWQYLTSKYLTVAQVRHIMEVERPATLDNFCSVASEYSPRARANNRMLTMPRDERIQWVRKISRSIFDDNLKEFPKFKDSIKWIGGEHEIEDVAIVEGVSTHTFQNFYASDAGPTKIYLLADNDERLIGWCISPYYSELLP